MGDAGKSRRTNLPAPREDEEEGRWGAGRLVQKVSSSGRSWPGGTDEVETAVKGEELASPEGEEASAGRRLWGHMPLWLPGGECTGMG